MGDPEIYKSAADVQETARKAVVLMPAYEPDSRFPELAEEVGRAGFSLIVVDDGSGPGCEALFQKAGCRAVVLTHDVNRGKGCALKTGLAYIQDHFPEKSTVITMDSDGQHTVRDARKLCAYAQAHPEALVLGSRTLTGHVPLRSRFGNTVTRFVYRLATGLSLHDTQTGLRAFDRGLIPFLLSVPGQRYEYEMNVLLACAKQHIPVAELEIETIYRDKNAGSHFDTMKDSFRIYREILKFSASSFLSFLVDYGLYALLLRMTGDLTLSNVGARLVSASFNYTANRTFVFQSKTDVWQSAVQYVLLAAVILAGNTFLLNLLADVLGMNRYLAKLAVESLFFVISWLVQHHIIFRRKASRR